MKIFNPQATLIDGLTPKVLETGNSFFLNTQMYLKSNLAPIPFEFYRTYGSPYHLNIYKNLYCASYSWNRKDVNNAIIKDEFITNRYYIFRHCGYVSAERRMYLMVLDEDNASVEYVYSETNYGDYQFIQYIYQTDRYLYFTARSNKTWVLTRYDKTNNSTSNPISLGCTYSYPEPELLYADDAFFYFASYSDNNIAITRYSVSANTQITAVTYRGQMTTTGNYNLTQRLCKIQLSDTEYGVYAYNLGQPDQPLGIYSVDITKDFNTTFATACTYTPCTITWNESITELKYNTEQHSCSTIYRIFRKTINRKDYMFVFTNNENFEHASYINFQGIYVFRMDDNENLTFLTYEKVNSTQQINGFLLDEKMTTCIVAYNQAFEILKFNTLKEKFITTGTYISQIYDVGYDEVGRLWYLKTDGSVHLVNLDDAHSVDVKFEKEYYEYTGELIHTYIIFNAKTYMGEVANGKFQLVIEGPAVFEENQEKKYIFEYTEETIIHIVINGAAPITIYPKYISEGDKEDSGENNNNEEDNGESSNNEDNNNNEENNNG